jgi:hypothetical protein
MKSGYPRLWNRDKAAVLNFKHILTELRATGFRPSRFTRGSSRPPTSTNKSSKLRRKVNIPPIRLKGNLIRLDIDKEKIGCDSFFFSEMFAIRNHDVSFHFHTFP